MNDNKPEISEHEAEELIKGMGRLATVMVYPDGMVRATAFSADPRSPRVQNEVDNLLLDIQKKYRIVKKRHS